MPTTDPKKIGLYLHIPFCSSLCHYCDFVKTANWGQSNKEQYFKTLCTHVRSWVKNFYIPSSYTIPTVFLGGGTPGIFTKEYEEIFKIIRPLLDNDVEITIEINPENIREQSLAYWKSLGINRLSIGVQTFSNKGLLFLKRQQDVKKTIQAINLAKTYFPNFSLDLIYGWKDQTLTDWANDLEQLASLNPMHASLYNLTFADKTPLGRAYARGKLSALDDQLLYDYYLLAHKHLTKLGFIHEEVSNLAKPGYSCKHNWAYWQGEYYVGIGIGAHGCVPAEDSPIGLRYAYPSNDRQWVKEPRLDLSELTAKNFSINNPGFHVEQRKSGDWLTEYIGSALRTHRGVSLKKILRVTGKIFQPRGFVAEAVADNILCINEGYLTVSTNEWFRETAWCVYILECFINNKEIPHF